MIKVLMVCTGNICRSPMAEYALKKMVVDAGLQDQIFVDSAGISDEEVGNTIHRGTVGILSKYSILHNAKRPARQIRHSDLSDFDYLLAMDRGHLNTLQRMLGMDSEKVSLFLKDAFVQKQVSREDVPDPWYDGQFERTYDLVIKGCAAFLERLRTENNL